MSGCGSSSRSGMPETPVMPEGGDDDGEGTGIETVPSEDEQAAAPMRIAMAIGPDSIRADANTDTAAIDPIVTVAEAASMPTFAERWQTTWHQMRHFLPEKRGLWRLTNTW